MKTPIHTPATSNVRSLCTVPALEDRLRHCVGSEDYVLVIRALAATQHRSAIRVLASLLDSVGPIAEAAIAALLTFGPAAIPAMRWCVTSDDADMIRHAHFVLAELGDEDSKDWLDYDQRERIEAYLDRMGFSDLTWDEWIANEADEEDGVA